jgi:HAE1 family hydrophobic/amphiphilic exporter-1
VVSLAIMVSAMVSLTLVPMLASRYIRHAEPDDPALKWTAWFERFFEWMLARYSSALDFALVHRALVMLIAAGTLVLTIVLVVLMPKGFFPTEDIGQISVNAEAVEDISFPAMSEIVQRVSTVIRQNPAVDTVVMSADQTNNGRLFINLKERSERKPMEKVLEELRREVRVIPGVNVYFNPIQNLRLGGRVSKSASST